MTHSGHQLYGLVGQHIDLLNLIAPQRIGHNGFTHGREILGGKRF